MQLSKAHIEEYQKLYEEIHGCPLDFQSAEIELRALVSMLNAIFINYKSGESDNDSE